MNRPSPVRIITPTTDPDTVLNMREVAQLLGVTPVTARRKVATNATSLSAFRTGGQSSGPWRCKLGMIRAIFNIPK